MCVKILSVGMQYVLFRHSCFFTQRLTNIEKNAAPHREEPPINKNIITNQKITYEKTYLFTLFFPFEMTIPLVSAFTR